MEVERETIIEAEPERVWEALTDDDLLSDWLAEDASIDPVEGGEVQVGERQGTVRTADEERELSFTWERPGEDESLVTFTLEPVETGTRVVVVERAIAPVSMSASSWGASLGRLRLVLGSLVLA